MQQIVTAVAMVAVTAAATGAAELQKAVDLQKVMVGVWVVDEKARMEASPLYALSTPEKKKELEKQMAGMPATVVEFKAGTWGFDGGKLVPFTVIKNGPKQLVLDTSDPFTGNKDQLTLEYVSDASLKMTMKSQGITLILNRKT